MKTLLLAACSFAAGYLVHLQTSRQSPDAAESTAIETPATPSPAAIPDSSPPGRSRITRQPPASPTRIEAEVARVVSDGFIGRGVMGDRTYEGERSTFFVTGHPKARTAAQDDMLMFVGRRIGTYDLGRERLPAYEFVAMDEAQLSKPPEKANAWMWKKN